MKSRAYIIVSLIASILVSVLIGLWGYTILSLNGEYTGSYKVGDNYLNVNVVIEGNDGTLTINGEIDSTQFDDVGTDIKVDRKSHKLIEKNASESYATYKKKGNTLKLNIQGHIVTLRKKLTPFKFGGSPKTPVHSNKESSTSKSSSSSEDEEKLTKQEVEDFSTKLVGKTGKLSEEMAYDFYSSYDDGFVMLDASDENGEYVNLYDDGWTITEITSVTDNGGSDFTINVIAKKG